jgi:uncharacterized membrane protein
MSRTMAGLRHRFVQGLLLILPLALTLALLRWLFLIVTAATTPLVHRLMGLAGMPASDSPALRFFVPLIGIALTLLLVLVVGVVGGHYVGRRLYALIESLLLRVPLVKWFYGSARQLMDALRATGGGAFREVVLVEFPRRGVWSLGFVTASATGILPQAPHDECVYVFVPTTPIPTSGYTIVVRREEAPPAAMSVDEGLKLIVSGGFISPAARGEAAPT